MKILCIIPARSGSKSLPHKNIKLFKDKPLLAHSIIQAKQSKHKMRIIVSTDSEKYAKIAREYGAVTPFLRPKEISGDLSTDYEFIKHAINYLKKNENYIPDIIVQLRPTYPTRKVNILDDTIDTFINNYDKYTSLRTVVPIEKCPQKMYYIEHNTLIPYFNKWNNIKEPYNKCRQEFPITYLHNGYIDILKTKILEHNTITGDNIYPYILSETELYDIDTENDFNKALKV